MNANVWTAACNLAAALRVDYRRPAPALISTRSRLTCPRWCAGHRCAIRLGYASGEHRSEPATRTLPYGTVVATRVETGSGAEHLELRISVRLDRDETVAARQAYLLAVGVDLTVRAVMAEDTPWLMTA